MTSVTVRERCTENGIVIIKIDDYSLPNVIETKGFFLYDPIVIYLKEY